MVSPWKEHIVTQPAHWLAFVIGRVGVSVRTRYESPEQKDTISKNGELGDRNPDLPHSTMNNAKRALCH